MDNKQAIGWLKLAVPIRALTREEFEKFIIAVNMAMNSLEAWDKVITEIEENNPDNYYSDKSIIITKKTVIDIINKHLKEKEIE